MSRTEPRDALNLSSSTLSLSEASEVSEVEGEVDDIKVERILSEETKNYEIISQLPPTPKRPTTRSQTRASVSPAVSTSSLFPLPPPQRKGRGKNKDSGANVSPTKSLSSVSSVVSGGSTRRSSRTKRTERDICRDFGFDLEDSELEEIEKDDDEDRDRKDNIIDDLLDLGLGKKKAPGKVKHSTFEEDKLDRQINKLRTKVPLEINGDGRCAVLHEDVSTTVKTTLEKINALVSVLEITRDKLIREDKSLVYTAPPVRIQRKPNLPRGGIIP